MLGSLEGLKVQFWRTFTPTQWGFFGDLRRRGRPECSTHQPEKPDPREDGESLASG
jgi:hypothetical protein